MTHTASALTRRRFFGMTLGGILLADAINLDAAPAIAGETKHFFYRMAPEGPYIDSQRGKTAFGFGNGRIFLSEGNAKSWTHSAEFFDANKIIARHVHNVTYNPTEKAFYACTGDLDRGDGSECHWLRGIYDAKADAWSWKVIVSVNSDSRYKGGGINFVDGRIYWISDANGPKLGPRHDRGIFSCAPADIANTEKHTLLFDPDLERTHHGRHDQHEEVCFT